jgi:hypothetical protein
VCTECLPSDDATRLYIRTELLDESDDYRFRDEHLTRAIDSAIYGSSVVYIRVEVWKLEDGEVVEEKVVECSEGCFKRCVSTIEENCSTLMTICLKNATKL